jgi:glycosyltransferase involved in cell wall biosynthesis
MRVLHVILRLAQADGGPPRGLVNLAEAQARSGEKNGDKIVILPCSSSGGKPILDQGRHGNLTVLPTQSESLLKFPDIKIYTFIDSIMNDYDIVHVHGSWRYHLIAACKAAFKYKKPVIVRPAGNLGYLPRRHKAFFKMPYLNLIEKKYLNKASGIHCCTQKELNEIESLNIKTEHFILPNPVDEKLLDIKVDDNTFYKQYPGLKPSDLVMCYLGRIAPIKNLELLLRAFIKVAHKKPQVNLILAGPLEDKNLADLLKSETKKAGLQDRVFFPGMVIGEIKAALLRRADIFVQPSSHENFGLSVVEAMLFGVPCIVNQGVGLAEEIRNNKAGLVFPNDENILVEYLENMCEDPDFRMSCKNNSEVLSNEFKTSVIIEKLRTIYLHYLKNIR